MSKDSSSKPGSSAKRPDAPTDVELRALRRDTTPDMQTPAAAAAAAIADTTIEETPEALGFEESIDTEVDFDALRAVQELEDSLAAAQSTSGQGKKQGESYVEILESEVEQLSALIKSKDQELSGKDKEIRAARAEIEKSRERIERDAARQQERRNRKLLLAFIEVLDDLERALESARSADHNPAVVDGIELVRKRFLAKLGELGVTHRPAMGEPFDPEMHDAAAAVPTDDPDKNGIIVGVIREGYAIGEETLRPAQVAVGKAG